MKSFKYLGLALIATTILGAAPVFAEENTPITDGSADGAMINHKVPDQLDADGKVIDKNTDAQVKIIGKTVKPEEPVDPKDPKDPKDPDPNQIANLELVKVPKIFYFETTKKSDQYTLTADKTTEFKQSDGKVKKAIEDGAEYRVFSDASGAHYKVVSVIDKQLVFGEKKVDVNSFKVTLEGQAAKELVGTNGIVMDQSIQDFDSTGNAAKAVEGIEIGFKAAEGTKIENNDLYAGKITNTLYNVYNETIKK